MLLFGLLAVACGIHKEPLEFEVDPHHPDDVFVVVDDLRPQMNCYGQEWILSPHMDRLAQNGLLFERAYCQQAVCAPSRTGPPPSAPNSRSPPGSSAPPPAASSA